MTKRIFITGGSGFIGSRLCTLLLEQGHQNPCFKPKSFTRYGQPWLSWVALDDICHLILFLAKNNQCEGIYNATSPNPMTSITFTKTLGKPLKHPTILPMPAFVLKAILGEASSLFLDSQCALPQRAIEAGFTFKYLNIEPCLVNSFANKQPL
jgi:NAD dependent epimerase/dehydratase family enzyme